MQRLPWIPLTLAGALALSLAACDRGATGNANAPGSPGANDTVVTQPAVPDGPPGGPSGVKGSAPHPGSSGGDMVTGATGSGGVSSPGLQPAQPGTGVAGGLGPEPGAAVVPPSAAPAAGTNAATGAATLGGPANTMDGSRNDTSSNAVGQR